MPASGGRWSPWKARHSRSGPESACPPQGCARRDGPGLPQAPAEPSRAPPRRGSSDVPDTALRPHSAAQGGHGPAASPTEDAGHSPTGRRTLCTCSDRPREEGGTQEAHRLQGTDEWSHRKPPLPELHPPHRAAASDSWDASGALGDNGGASGPGLWPSPRAPRQRLGPGCPHSFLVERSAPNRPRLWAGGEPGQGSARAQGPWSACCSQVRETGKSQT